MPALEAIYRPVTPTGLLDHLQNAIGGELEAYVQLMDEPEARVDIVKDVELKKTFVPRGHTSLDVVKELTGFMPDSFSEDLIVQTQGVTYTKREIIHPVLGCGFVLFAKIKSDQTLLNENDAVFDVLAKYGLIPDMGHEMYFNVPVGTVALKALSGVAKQRLRHKLSDAIPTILTLGHEIIKRSSE